MRNVTSLLRHLSAGLILALALGCAGGRSPRSADEIVAPATIDVENHDFYDMTMYVLLNGQRTRIGIAAGNKTTTLTIPHYLINGTSYLRFEARPLAGNRSPVSEEIDVSSGDALVMIINPGG